MWHAEKQTTLQRVPHYCLEWRLNVVNYRDLDWQSKPHCYCLTCRECDSVFLSQLTSKKWTLSSCLLQQYQLWEGLPLCVLYFGYEILLNTSQDFISPAQCPGASTWRGGVTMNNAYICTKTIVQFRDPLHKNAVWNMNGYVIKFSKWKLPFTSLY
jgi:hypothetical protein